MTALRQDQPSQELVVTVAVTAIPGPVTAYAAGGPRTTAADQGTARAATGGSA